ncbi:hypothetical protein WOC76_12630 [Methylocystis sp. IM3]|uniref:hypothetical protein n=1 Tax=unclassified Methylocystis TaxID=2625913 RepID=UPI0030F595AC
MPALKLSRFLERLPKNAPAHISGDLATAFEIVGKFTVRAKEIRSDPTLSRAGVAIAIEKVLTSGALGHMKQLQNQAQNRLLDMKAQRGVLRERALKHDHAPELMAEIRGYLRGLPQADRMKAVASGDPMIKVAALSAPAFLSGLPDDFWAATADAVTQEKFGQALEEIDVIERSYAEMHSAISLATDDLRRESGIEPGDFAKVAEAA